MMDVDVTNKISKRTRKKVFYYNALEKNKH